jgi:hypothetical protein
MKFLNAVATLAEANGHHPDLHLTSYRDVEVRCSMIIFSSSYFLDRLFCILTV